MEYTPNEKETMIRKYLDKYGNKASDAQVKAIWAIGKKANVSEDYIKAEYGVESIKDLTKDQASQLITEMQKFVNDQAS